MNTNQPEKKIGIHKSSGRNVEKIEVITGHHGSALVKSEFSTPFSAKSPAGKNNDAFKAIFTRNVPARTMDSIEDEPGNNM